MEAKTRAPEVRTTLLVMAITTLWLLSSPATLSWIVSSLLASWARLHLVLLVLFLVAFLTRIRRENAFGIDLGMRPRPALLTLISAFFYFVAQRELGLDRLSLFPWALTSYGLLGFWLEPQDWRKLRVPALTGLVLLPFSEQIDLYLGFPIRAATASFVSALLTQSSPAITSASVLIFETGLANIDTPCSGVRGLWAGSALSLFATWFFRKRISLRWFFANLVYAASLLCANTLRVALIVTVGVLFERPRAAEILHEPIGLAGFIASSSLLLALLVLWVDDDVTQGPKPPLPKAQKRLLSLGLSFGTLALFVTMAAFPSHQKIRATTLEPPRLSQILSTHEPAIFTPSALTEKERMFFKTQGAQFVSKQRFKRGEVQGSVILVYGTTWRAHHNPERCLMGSGLLVEDRDTILVEPGFLIRRLSFRNTARESLYWFQSKKRTTSDFADRIWSHFWDQERSWVLVSILVDDRERSLPAPFLIDFRQTVQTLLEEAST